MILEQRLQKNQADRADRSVSENSKNEKDEANECVSDEKIANILEGQDYCSVELKIKQLSNDSGLKRINAYQFSRQIKKQLEMYDEEDGLTFEDFKSILEP